MKQTHREWLETDGLGGFASGTISGERTRRYHALLLSARPADDARIVLVNGIEAQVQQGAEVFPLSTQRYAPDVLHPHGNLFIHSFQLNPWPTWEFTVTPGIRIRQEFFIPRETSAIVLRWRLLARVGESVSLTVRPLLSGRNYHSLHHENPDFQFFHTGNSRMLEWSPYHGVPNILAMSNGAYANNPLWFRQFLYTQEAERGLDCCEDLASPGSYTFELTPSPAILVLSASGPNQLVIDQNESLEDVVEKLDHRERLTRHSFPSRLHQSADQFLIRSGQRSTIIAGYPWFTDWGRDTFIALRGLCLTTGRLDEAGQILLSWSGTISGGMLPNRFPDGSREPEFNSVDASLWYIIAAHEYLQSLEKARKVIQQSDRERIQSAVLQILTGYFSGTRYGIQADDDGLLKAGTPGVQLTWMDAKVRDWVVTPRIGKPVEIQALWVNALWIGSQWDPRWTEILDKAQASFQIRFWNEEASCLHDVIDVDHEPGKVDSALRPNQILAVGGLPLCLLDLDQARRMMQTVERQLLTPLGLRTLSPSSPQYQGHCTGDILQRDAAYHQGTVWPWLTGPFVEAWLRVHGDSAGNRTVARARFLQPLLNQLEAAGLGHVSEIFDGDPSETATGPRQIPRGCPFQAWSLSELLRALELVSPKPSHTQ